ncbi:MAG: hypothetical protein U9Q07_11255, partial [Planctomycetota bacterium]|nr:hypothetical protein [Planctomycetota bacterium]
LKSGSFMKKTLLSLVFLVVLTAPSYAEDMNLTTYYTAPLGSYDRLRLAPRNTEPTCNAALEGELYYDVNTGSIFLCDGTGTWIPVSSVWTHDAATDKAFLTNDDYDTDGVPTFVGLGTDAPVAHLHLSGSGAEAGEILLENTRNALASASVNFSDSDHATRYKMGEWDDIFFISAFDAPCNATGSLYITKEGRLGIGTETPESRLEIMCDDRPHINQDFINATGKGEILFYQDVTLLGGIGAHGPNYVDADLRNGLGITSNFPGSGSVAFRTTSTADGGIPLTRMLLNNDGDLGIGTTNPIARVDIRNGHTIFAYEAGTPHGSVHIAGTEPYLTFSDTDAPCRFDAWRMGAKGNNFLLAVEENDCANTTLERFFIEGGTGDMILGDLPIENPQTPDAQFHISNNGIGWPDDAFRVDDEANDPSPFSIDADGSVGIGTPFPSMPLHLKGDNATGGEMILQNTAVGGSVGVTFVNLNEPDDWKISVHGDYMDFVAHENRAAWRSVMTIRGNGNIGIGTMAPAATLDVVGAIFQRGIQLHSDYVFQDDYELESIEEHAAFMWKNKNLKAIPPKEIDEEGREVVNVGDMNRGIVEELEKLYIYMEQINERIKESREKLKKLSQ